MFIYKLGVIHFVGVEILTSFWFLFHNFGSRHSKSQSSALKTRMIV